MDNKNITVEREGKMAIITIDREKKLNILDAGTRQELVDIFSAIQEDTSIWGVVLTGRGRAFCSGMDLTEIKPTVEATVQLCEEMNRFTCMIEELSVPVIAAINGFALGGGLELALACDIRIAGDNAVLGLPEVTLGAIPGFGGTQRLPRLIGIEAAKELLFTGRKINAKEALSLGLVSKVVPEGSVLEESKIIMAKITQNAPLAVSACKELVNKGMQCSLKEGLMLSNMIVAELFLTSDKEEGVRAFSEKRLPVFTRS